jgi:hypothetical protein
VFSAVTLFDIAGKQIGTYQLSASGSSSIAVNELNKGVYILKFTGTSNAVVKVIK